MKKHDAYLKGTLFWGKFSIILCLYLDLNVYIYLIRVMHVCIELQIRVFAAEMY